MSQPPRRKTATVQEAFFFGEASEHVESNDMHHLRRKKCGAYQMRITVGKSAKFVGERVILHLRTKCLEEAKQRRDLILAALKKADSLSSETCARTFN